MTALLPTLREFVQTVGWISAVLGTAAVLAGYLVAIDWFLCRSWPRRRSR